MDLTVVIIGKNVQSTLNKLVDSVKSQTNSPIIYVDSESTDKSLEMAQKLNLITTSISKPLNAAKARNKGMTLAKSDLILFLDGDTELSPHFLAKALPSFLDDKVAAVYGKRREKFPESTLFNFIVDYEWELSDESGKMGGDVLARREAFEKVHGYNENLKAAEDTDLSHRLSQAGYKIIFLDFPMTYHNINMTHLKTYWDRAKRTGYGYASVYNLHKKEPGEFWKREYYRSLIKGILLLFLPLILLVIAVLDPYLFLLITLIASLLILYKMARLKKGTFLERLSYIIHSQLVHIPHLFGELEYLKEKRW